MLNTTFVLHIILYNILSAFCVYQIEFFNLNVGPFYYNKIIQSFSTRSKMACVLECLKLHGTCTHTVTNHLRLGRVECTLLDGVNGLNELNTDGKGTSLWMKGIESITPIDYKLSTV